MSVMIGDDWKRTQQLAANTLLHRPGEIPPALEMELYLFLDKLDGEAVTPAESSGQDLEILRSGYFEYGEG
jgi:hypothetical protein